MPRVVVGFADPEVERVREVALAAFEEARADWWPFLSDVLGRRLRGVSPEDAAVVTAVVHALVKYDRLLAFAARSEAGAAKLAALRLLARSGGPGEVDARIEAIDRPLERLGVAYSFPDWLVALVEADVGAAHVERALATMNDVAPRFARANALKTTRDACIAALAEENVPTRPGAHGRHAFAIEGRASPFRTQAFARGDFEMQDEASQLVAELVAPPPGSVVVDACAGAGGKALALAAELAGKGGVVALDVAEGKLEELRRRARRAGASNVRAIAVDLLAPGEALAPFAGKAARVLVDAPCTGLGAIRRNPEVRWRLSPEQVESLRSTQESLLRAAAALVAPRGRLVYATCSFLKREGQAVIEAFLAGDPRFVPVTARDVLGRARTEAVATASGRYLQTWRFDEAAAAAAHEGGVDGFFGAVARRSETTNEARKENGAKEAPPEAPEHP